jgi:hypothetical protein
MLEKAEKNPLPYKFKEGGFLFTWGLGYQAPKGVR